jgi:BA14K-like protein
MRFRMIVPVTLLVLGSAVVASPAFAQTGRAMNDGGFAPAQSGAAPSQSGVAQYNGSGQVVGTGPTIGAGLYNQVSGSCAQRFRSYDPSTGTYLGSDGRRHACQQ